MGDRIDIVYGGISVLRGLEHDDLAEELLRREVEETMPAKGGNQ